MKTALVPRIADPPEEQLVEAMLALTEARRRFVVAILETGGRNHEAAAEIAGIGGTPNSRRVSACRLMHDP